jgi:hypothetical protein
MQSVEMLLDAYGYGFRGSRQGLGLVMLFSLFTLKRLDSGEDGSEVGQEFNAKTREVQRRKAVSRKSKVSDALKAATKQERDRQEDWRQEDADRKIFGKQQ